MSDFVFCVGVFIALRIEYLVVRTILEQKFVQWSDNKRRIFANRAVSCTHATLSSLGCLCSLLSDPHFIRDAYDYRTDAARYVFYFSMIYFVYDMFDMYIHGEANNSKEYFVHHSLVAISFAIILRSGKLFGFAMIGLLVEVQTIFLHLRTMIRLMGTSKDDELYGKLSTLNMTCLFLFRHVPITYLLHFMIVRDDKVPTALRIFLIGGLLFLTYHNTHLTISMAKNDGFFGYPGVQILDEDDCDPLGSTNTEKKKQANQQSMPIVKAYLDNGVFHLVELNAIAVLLRSNVGVFSPCRQMVRSRQMGKLLDTEAKNFH